MNAFCFDLDNTFIYSHRRRITGEKITAEIFENKKQSFMTRYTYDFMRNNKDIKMIPVTTRTRNQYERVFILNGICDTAVVCNGGSILINGVIDESWESETIKLAGNEIDAVNVAMKFIRRFKDSYEIHAAAPYMVYFRSDNTAEEAELIKNNFDMEKLYVGHDGRKVYCIAKSVNKGQAILRLREKFGLENIIAAGDSEFDIPMLNMASEALASEKIFNLVSNSKKHVLNGEIISDQICMLLKQTI